MKKLFISIFTAVFALFALGTSTFAWFSMNDTVTAKDMTIKIKSDASFLLIDAGHVAHETIQGHKLTSVSAEHAEATILPAAHNTVANMEAADTAANWYYRHSKDPASSGSEANNTLDVVKPLSSLTGYVLVNEFSLTVAEGAIDMADIKVGVCTVTVPTGGKDAVRVLVATADNAEEFSGTGEHEGTEILQASLTSTSEMWVKVYIYWDGNHSEVYTNNIDNLKDISVEITFNGSVNNA